MLLLLWLAQFALGVLALAANIAQENAIQTLMATNAKVSPPTFRAHHTHIVA